jgi:hypothetical protein
MKFLDALDHPVTFALFTTMVVLGSASLMTWAGKRWNLPGLATISQTP